MNNQNLQNNNIRRVGLAANVKILIALAALAGLIIASLTLPVKDYMIGFLQWVESLGHWAYVAMVGAYIVSCVFLLPGSVLTLGAGFLFKTVTGTVVVSAGSVLGAGAAFLTGRFLARDWIAKKMEQNARFAAVDKAVGQQGFKIVLLTRLSPVFPFNLLNYAFGLTRVSFRDYILASWIGMFPATVMFVYFGAGLRSFADAAAGNVDSGPVGQILFWLGLAATVTVTVLITKIARKSLQEIIPNNNSEDRSDKTD